MAEFLTTLGISSSLEKIIRNANRELILVSPFLQVSDILIARLKEAGNRRLKIKIVFGKEELNNSQKKVLSEVRGIELSYCEHLHAKCYLNESMMVITSMNMYEFSERKNREMGILLTKDGDAEIYEEARLEVDSILKASKARNLLYPSEKQGKSAKGFCIRCSTGIKFNPNAPYCNVCYTSWAHWGNPEFIEKVCHNCGEKEQTSMQKPECYACYSQH